MKKENNRKIILDTAPVIRHLHVMVEEVRPRHTKAGEMDYPVLITKLSDAEGGGFVGRVPDLPGCMSDGDTPQEALANTISAMDEWLSEAARLGREIPTP